MGTNQNILLCQGQLLILAFISNLLSFRMFLGPYFCYCKSDGQKFSFLFFIVHPTQWSRRLFLLLYIFHNLPCIIWSLYYLWHLYQTYFSFFLPHAITILHLICFIQSLSVFAASSPQEGVKVKSKLQELYSYISWRQFREGEIAEPTHTTWMGTVWISFLFSHSFLSFNVHPAPFFDPPYSLSELADKASGRTTCYQPNHHEQQQLDNLSTFRVSGLLRSCSFTHWIY